MKEPEYIDGLPFYIPSSEMEDYMTVGALIEELIYFKEKYDMYYPDDNYINLACNILEELDRQKTINEILQDK